MFPICLGFGNNIMREQLQREVDRKKKLDIFSNLLFSISKCHYQSSQKGV